MTGTDIKQKRQAMNMSRYRLSKATGINYKSIWRWETGKATPRPSSLKKVELVLGRI